MALEENGLFEDIEPLRPNLDDPKYYEVLPDFIKKTINRERYFWGYDTPEKYTTNMRAIYRMLAGLDRIIGRVIDALKEQGLDENTVIIYTADNGYYMGDRGLQGKWSHFDQSVHVPLIVYDPRMRKELRGRVPDQLISSLDFPATMLDLAKVAVPAKYQGVSILPLLNGETPVDWRKEVFGEHHSGGANLPHWYGVRDHRYTYAHYYRNKTELLYDREKDPTELTNIAGDPDYRTILADLRKRSDAYYEKYTSARGPVPSGKNGGVGKRKKAGAKGPVKK
jgi:arylsulfatase A-like enzyme